MCVPIFWNLGKKPIQKLATIFHGTNLGKPRRPWKARRRSWPASKRKHGPWRWKCCHGLLWWKRWWVGAPYRLPLLETKNGGFQYSNLLFQRSSFRWYVSFRERRILLRKCGIIWCLKFIFSFKMDIPMISKVSSLYRHFVSWVTNTHMVAAVREK